MESEQMNEFRPLILVAEDDDSNFKMCIRDRCSIILLQVDVECLRFSNFHLIPIFEKREGKAHHYTVERLSLIHIFQALVECNARYRSGTLYLIHPLFWYQR